MLKKQVLQNIRNKFAQKRPAAILDKISIQLSMLSIVILMKNGPFFFKTFIFDGCFCKYKSNFIQESVSFEPKVFFFLTQILG